MTRRKAKDGSVSLVETLSSSNSGQGQNSDPCMCCKMGGGSSESSCDVVPSYIKAGGSADLLIL